MSFNDSFDPNRPERGRVKMSPGYFTVQLILFLVVMLAGWGTNSWQGVLLGWIVFFALIYRVLRYFNKIEPITIQSLRTKLTTAVASAAGNGSGTTAEPAMVLTDRLLLGTDPQGQLVIVTDSQLAAHGLILGATGSGKSTSLLSILCDEITRGAPVVAVDLKGSAQFTEQLQTAAQQAGRPFLEWKPEGPLHWNPLAYGDASELKDKLISAETFTEPHYQRAAERYLQTALQVHQAVAPDRPVTLGAVVGLLNPNTLKAMLTHAPQELISRVGPYLTSLNRDQTSGILGLESRLAILSESAVGEYLQPASIPEDQIDLRHALTGGDEVVLFSLNSSRYGKMTGQLAAMIIQDLITVAGHRQNLSSRPLRLIAVDEFSALDADNILNLFVRSRSAGMSVMLSTQELADLDRLADEFREQVVGNIGVLLAHRQNVPDSAELIASMIGTHKVWQTTMQTEKVRTLGGIKTRGTGLGTGKEVEEFIIHPNIIKNLATGQAVLVTKIPYANATPVQVKPWRPA